MNRVQKTVCWSICLMLNVCFLSVQHTYAYSALEVEKEYKTKNCILVLQTYNDSTTHFHNAFSKYLNSGQILNDFDQLNDEANRQSKHVYNLYNIMIGQLSHAIDVCMYVEGKDDLIERLVKLQESSHEFHKYLEVILFDQQKRSFNFQSNP